MDLKFKSFARSIFLCSLVLITSSQLFSQDSYKIDFRIKGFKDTIAYLGHYFWESTYLIDTTKVNSNGTFSFDGKKTLPQGVYMLIVNGASGKVKLFDFVVGSDQEFSFESNYENLVGEMTATGDVDNKIFFENLKHYAERTREAQPFVALLRDSTLMEQNKVDAREKLNRVTEKVKHYQNDLLKKYPTTVTARILKANQEIEVPEAPILPGGKKDPTFGYKYFKAHYWDNFNLADEALLRLPNPLYKEKLKYYLDKMVVQNPDSLMKEVDILAHEARKNKETYKYLVWKCITEYQQHPIMGMDAVYVHLSDKFIASGELDYWLNDKAKKNIKDYADQIRRSLIGQTGPNLIMQDQNFQPRNMYDIAKKYTLLFIFDPECPVCRAETPQLVNFYNASKNKFDLEVYAVSSDSSMKKMRDFIKEMNTPWITVNGPRSYVGSYRDLYDATHVPSLYILDEKKKIIAKKPPIEKLDEFLTHHEMALNQKK